MYLVTLIVHVNGFLRYYLFRPFYIRLLQYVWQVTDLHMLQCTICSMFAVCDITVTSVHLACNHRTTKTRGQT